MPTHRYRTDCSTSWVITLASLWFAFFVAMPTEVLEETSSDPATSASSLDQSDTHVPDGESDPPPPTISLVPRHGVVFTSAPVRTFIADERTKSTQSVLTYAPKQSPPV